MFVACGIWCLADVSSVSPSSEQTGYWLHPHFRVAAAHHYRSPQPAPIWPCSSVTRVTVICSDSCGFESHRGRRFFLFLCVDPFPFWGYHSEGITWNNCIALQRTAFKSLYLDKTHV